MKKKPSESKKSTAPAARHQNSEKHDVRAQKRIVTQNDLDELAGQETKQQQGQAIESESDQERQ